MVKHLELTFRFVFVCLFVCLFVWLVLVGWFLCGTLATLELTEINVLASASKVLGLKACPTTARLRLLILTFS